MGLKIIVLARDEDARINFLNRNPFPYEGLVTFIFGAESYLEEINKTIQSESNPVLFLHDDVTVPHGFMVKVNTLIRELNNNYNYWGVAGNAGIANHIQSLDNNRTVLYLIDGHGGPNATPSTVSAETLDGNCLLVNCPVLRAKNIKLPILRGFHFYDIFLCICSINCGCGVFISSNLFLFHKSKGNQNEFDKSKLIAGPMLAKLLQDNSIDTINGKIFLRQQFHAIEEKESLTFRSLRCTKTRVDRALSVFILANSPENLRKTLMSLETLSRKNSNLIKKITVMGETERVEEVLNDLKVNASSKCQDMKKELSDIEGGGYCLFLNAGSEILNDLDEALSISLNSSHCAQLYYLNEPLSSECPTELLSIPNFKKTTSCTFENFIVEKNLLEEFSSIKGITKDSLIYLPAFVIERSVSPIPFLKGVALKKRLIETKCQISDPGQLVNFWSSFFYEQRNPGAFFNYILFKEKELDLYSKLSIIEGRCQELEKLYNLAITSRSWRITKPLRKIASILKSVRNNFDNR